MNKRSRISLSKSIGVALLISIFAFAIGFHVGVEVAITKMIKVAKIFVDFDSLGINEDLIKQAVLIYDHKLEAELTCT